MLRRIRRGGIRARTTVAATVIVGVVFAGGATAMVAALGFSLHEAAESAAETRAEEIAVTVSSGGLEALGIAGRDGDDDAEDLAWQVTRNDEIVASGGTAGFRIPADEGIGDVGDDAYAIAVEGVSHDGNRYVVAAAASLDDAQESVAALVPLLMVGIPVAIALVALTLWVVTGRALRPVEQIRRRVEEIKSSGLDARVPVPPTRDEIGRLASTMNAMLERLDVAANRQTQFISDTSHELRSPLASLRQTAEVAKIHPQALEPGELAEVVLEETGRLQNLVDQMLVLTRTGEVASHTRHTEVDVDDLVFAEAARIRRLHPDLVIDVSGVRPVRVSGDGMGLSQVVRNLADNAARHADRLVRFETGNRPDGIIELTVEDDGAGIPEDQRERVFERFVRLDEARTADAGGSGLGLAIVREVARAHGGEAIVGLSSAGGARFVVTLPAAS